MIIELINLEWFHWYEGSLWHIILWYSYIGIDNELMKIYIESINGIIIIRIWLTRKYSKVNLADGNTTLNNIENILLRSNT